MTTEMNTLAPALYVKIDDQLIAFPDLAPERPHAGIQPRLSDAELVTLAVMSALLGFTSERRLVTRQPRAQPLSGLMTCVTHRAQDVRNTSPSVGGVERGRAAVSSRAAGVIRGECH
ncbi:hypothetical protein ACFY2E_18705 [Nonomuraea jabiensis]|uniref:hypothetical protein n=1 Tax=Nonomuraea jabiensis TaxID=882448 RepID=UPI00369B82DB